MKTSYASLQAEPQLANQFTDYVLAGHHPCMMARSVFKTENVTMHEYGPLGHADNVPLILKDIQQFINNYPEDEVTFRSFIAIFADRNELTEIDFEQKLWQQLQLLHEADPSSWDPKVSDNPDSHDFSFSLCEQAFYVVGMHPNSSRIARQAPRPAIAFNLHQQFDWLREKGRYERVRDQIRKRDKALQGNINPMLADFGKGREVRQYSGRAVSKEWKCPFHTKQAKESA